MKKLKEEEFSTKGALFPFLKRIFSYSFRYKRWMTGFITFVLVVSLVEALTPLVWLNLLDNAIVPLVEQYKPQHLAGTPVEPDLGPLTKYILIIAVRIYVHQLCRQDSGICYV